MECLFSSEVIKGLSFYFGCSDFSLALLAMGKSSWHTIYQAVPWRGPCGERKARQNPTCELGAHTTS